jgi:histidinol-phosphate aminotransferase
VLFPDITYSFYPVYANLWSIPYRTPPLAEDFSIAVEDYLAADGASSGGVVFPNPNAPTARALPVPDVLRVVESQAKADKVVVVDEAYVDFGAESVVPAVADYPNLLTVHTLSKSRSLAGLRVGFAIGREELIEGIRRIKDSFNSYTLDRCALAGAAAAMEDSAYYDEVNARVVATRERTAAALRKLGFQGPPSAANFVFMRHPGVRGEDLFKGLREKGILVRWFNKPRIDQYLRISIGTDQEMDALVEACRELVG